MLLKNKKAFTLIETLLSVSIIVIILSLPLTLSFFSVNSYDLNSDYLVAKSILTKARSLSINNISDSNYGVKFTTNNITLFKGSSYSTRDQNFDDLYNIKSTITGEQEIVFFNNTGFVQNDVTITLNNGSNSKNILVNKKGGVE